MSFDWTYEHHADLTLKEPYALLQLRTEVFVVEQKYPYQEVGGLDLVGDTRHLMVWRDDQLLAYLCLLDPVRHEGQVVVGRVVSSSAVRDQGPGHQLVERALWAAERLWLDIPIYLSAQAHLQDCCSRYGFVAVTGVYLEDDISYIDMCRA